MPIDKFSGQWIPTRPFDREEPLSLEHRKQIHRFVEGTGVPFDDAADRRQRAYARFKVWHHEQKVAYAEELKRQGKEPPAAQDLLEEEEINEDDEQLSTHYWSRYPPE
jgi:hypothetical protein